MDKSKALAALQALSQETRLDAFRLLVQADREGMAAGDIAQHLDVVQNTMSAHLSSLVNAGMATSTRHGRSILYAVDFAGVRALLAYLMEDCCGGDPDRCQPLLDALTKDISP